MSHTPIAAALAAALFLAPCAQAQEAFVGAYAGLGLSYGETHSGISGTGAHDQDLTATQLDAFAGFTRAGSGNFVWGPEVSISGIAGGKTKSGGGLGTSQQDGGVLLGARLRGGFATEKAFFYAGLGLGLTNAVVEPDGNSNNDWALGTSIGLGVEFAVSDKWNARLDAQSFNLGRSNVSFGGDKRDTTLNHTRITLGIARKF